ncbi:MAG: hypothetical protein R2794_04055 [Chitinophagales bacterium]
MRRYVLIAVLALLAGRAFSQSGVKEITDENWAKLQAYEDTLQWLGDSTVQAVDWDTREEACVVLVKMLVKALKVENSFYYPFDSLNTVSIVNAPDNTFRLITWQLTMKDRTYRYYGTMQMNKPQLDMNPMIDMSLFIGNPQDTVLSANSWYGCIYYKIVKQKYRKDTYYLLFGWDGNDPFSNKKLVDVLSFDQFGKPVFGRPMFYFYEDPKPKTRIVIEYKEDASPVMNWDPDMKMIIISYLQPENPLSEGIFMTYIPDGTYIGFYRKRDKWLYKDKIFTRSLPVAPDNTPKRDGEDPNIYKPN